MSGFLACFTWSHSYWEAKSLFTWTDLEILHTSWVHNHIATTCYETTIASSHSLTEKHTLRYFHNYWGGWLYLLPCTLKSSTLIMATLFAVLGLSAIEILLAAPWTRTISTATHYKIEVSLTQTPTSKKSLTTSKTIQQTIHTPQKDENPKLKPSKNNQKTIQQTTLYNKRFTHLKLKQMKTSSKNRLITTKPYKKFIHFKQMKTWSKHPLITKQLQTIQ